VLLLNECLLLFLFISLSTQFGNFWIHLLHIKQMYIRRLKRAKMKIVRLAARYRLLDHREKLRYFIRA